MFEISGTLCHHKNETLEGIRTLSKWKADVNLRTSDEEEITPVQIAALSSLAFKLAN